MKFQTKGLIDGTRRNAEAVQWNATEDSAYEVFDFVTGVERRITDEAVVEIYPDGLDGWAVLVEPGQWIIRIGSGRYATCSNEVMHHKFEAFA